VVSGEKVIASKTWFDELAPRAAGRQRRSRSARRGGRLRGDCSGLVASARRPRSTAACIRTHGLRGLERDVGSRRRQEIHATVVEAIGRLMERTVRRLE
jgi:hypothetical protein